MKIKVLHISISDDKGGAAIAAGRLHKLMNTEQEFFSRMLVLVKNTSDVDSIPVNYFEKQKSRLGNLINNLLGKLKKSYGLFSFALIGNELNKNYLVKEAQVIYIHWVNNGMLSWSNIEQIIGLGKPVFLFCHDMWYFTGGCHYSNGCNLYTLNCSSCHFFENKKIQNLISLNYNRKKTIYQDNKNVIQILPSSDFYYKAIKSNIIEPSRIFFIPNILDTNKFRPSDVRKLNRKIRLLYGAMGGKANPYKGWDDFLFVTKSILATNSDLIEVAFFGYDFSEEELLDFDFNFIDYGVLHDQNKIIEMYQDADVFIFPSSQESFGQTLFESMSCGVIPISYNVGAAKDLIVNGECGYIVEIGDKIGLIDSIQQVLRTDIDFTKFKVRERILNNFSTKIILNKHQELIASVI